MARGCQASVRQFSCRCVDGRVGWRRVDVRQDPRTGRRSTPLLPCSTPKGTACTTSCINMASFLQQKQQQAGMPHAARHPKRPFAWVGTTASALGVADAPGPAYGAAGLCSGAWRVRQRHHICAGEAVPAVGVGLDVQAGRPAGGSLGSSCQRKQQKGVWRVGQRDHSCAGDGVAGRQAGGSFGTTQTAKQENSCPSPD